jgi:hypothetical protein
MGACDPIDWRGAWSLRDRLIYLISGRQTDSQEFKFFLRIFGQEHIAKIWEDHKLTQRPIPHVHRMGDDK